MPLRSWKVINNIFMTTKRIIVIKYASSISLFPLMKASATATLTHQLEVLGRKLLADNRKMLCLSCSLMIVIVTCVWCRKNESQATMKRLRSFIRRQFVESTNLHRRLVCMLREKPRSHRVTHFFGDFKTLNRNKTFIQRHPMALTQLCILFFMTP